MISDQDHLKMFFPEQTCSGIFIFIFIMKLTFLNPVLVHVAITTAFFICLMQTNNISLLKQSNSLSMTTVCVCRDDCLRNQKLLMLHSIIKKKLRFTLGCKMFPRCFCTWRGWGSNHSLSSKRTSRRHELMTLIQVARCIMFLYDQLTGLRISSYQSQTIYLDAQ